MKSLKTIQVLAKIGRIISKIIFILCIVGFCCIAAGIAAMVIGVGTVKIDGTTIHALIEEYAELNVPSIIAGMSCAAVYCAAGAVNSKFAEVYFKNELKDGTPFTHRGAKELLRLGILNIAIPAVAAALCAGGLFLANKLYPEIALKEFDGGAYLGVGIMMIVLSLFCRYGAELREGKSEGSSEA